MNISVKALSSDLLEDYLYFFDNIIFSENPGWSKCYCYSFHFTGSADQWNKKDNRAAVISLIRENKMNGYLVFSGNSPIGWCNANDRDSYQRLQKYYKLVDNADDKVCSIVCFLVSPEFRNKGIAGKLLQQIIIDYSARGYDYLEAYPGKGTLSCEKHYKGPPDLYRKFNFNIHKEYPDYNVVRRYLR